MKEKHIGTAKVTGTRCFCCSVTKLCPILRPHGLQHSRLPCPSLYPRICSYSLLLSRWYYLTISSSAAFFSSCLQSFPESGSFAMSWRLSSGGQSTVASATASVLSMNIQGWFQMVKNLPAVQKTWVWSLGQEDPLEKGMATHSSILAWGIPWTEEPYGLQSLESDTTEQLINTHTKGENQMNKIEKLSYFSRIEQNSSLLFSVIDITYPKYISDYISSLKFTK